MSFLGGIPKSQQGLFFGFAKLRLRLGGGDLEKKEIAEVTGKVLGDPYGIPVAGAELVNFAQRGRAVSCEDGGGKGTGLDRSGQAEDFEDVVEGDVLARETDELFQGGFGVAEAPLGLAGQQEKGLVRDFDFLRISDFSEVSADEGIGDPAEVEPLAAGEDGGRELLDLSGGEDEFDVRGGFFEGF